MGFASGGLSATQTLDAIVDDSTRFSGGDIATIEAKKHGMMDFWAEAPGNLTITSGASTPALPSVTLPAITGTTILHAYALFRIHSLYNSAGGSNRISGSCYVQVDESAGGWLSAILFRNECIQTEGSMRIPCGILFVGDVDILAKVGWGATTDFQWLNVIAASNNLVLNGFQTGVRVII